MKLKSIYINRKGYGPNPEELSGKIEYDNSQTTVAMVLSQEQAAKIVNLVAEESLRHAKELAGILFEDVRAQFIALAPTTGITLLEAVHVPSGTAGAIRPGDDDLPF